MEIESNLGTGNSLSGLSGDFVRTYKFFYGFLLLGIVFVLIGEWYNHPLAAMLWSFACLAAGGFVGFLFGIPRVLQQDGSAAQTQPAAGASARSTGYTLRVNTNLEQISDWLTKIIVGLTLIQLQKLPENLNRAASFIAYSLGPGEKFFAGAILVFFSIGGFLGGYLFTRLFLTGAFYRADQPGLPITQSEKDAIANTAVDIQELGTQQLTGDAAKAAKQILNKPLSELTSASDLAAWAKAQLDAGNYSEALEGYDKAIALLPNDLTLRVEKAIASRGAGLPTNVVKEQLLDAYKRLTPQTDKSIKANLYKSLTYTYLYLAPPEGFKAAIQYGEEYVNDPSNPKDGSIYVNLAAAYGQKYRWYQTHPESSVSLPEVRARALATVKAALGVDPNKAQKLTLLMDPAFPSKDPKENDLEVFIEDPEFREVLGMPKA